MDFDFSKYKNIDLIAFSVGVFASSVFDFGFEINRKIAISGNPYLFDEHFGLSGAIQDYLYNITEEICQKLSCQNRKGMGKFSSFKKNTRKLPCGI